MELRIIDNSENNINKDSVELKFIHNDSSIEFSSDGFPSALEKGLKNLLNWYFFSYASDLPSPANDKNTISRFISLGQKLGDQLLGFDHQLNHVREIIEDHGYNNLSVTIESNRLEFFDEPWEALVLPGSPYVLSTVCQHFNRRFIQRNETSNPSLIEQECKLRKEPPLSILHIISPSPDNTSISSAVEISAELLCYEDTLKYECITTTNADELRVRLGDRENPVHVVYFEGEIELLSSNEGLWTNACLGGIKISDIVSKNSSGNLPLFISFCKSYIKGNEIIECERGLAIFSRILLDLGIKNIVGISNYSDTKVQSMLLNTIIEKVSSGLTISQAVIETRKHFQRETQFARYRAKQTDFHIWPLLRHYSQIIPTLNNQKEPEIPSPTAQKNELFFTGGVTKSVKKLHGFNKYHLPPYSSSIPTNLITTALDNWQIGKHTVIVSGSGEGKTYQLHSLASLLVNQAFDFGFYFDFKEHSYTIEEMLDMTKPILESKSIPDGHLAVSAAKCIFVFDNLSEEQEFSLIQQSETSISQCLEKLFNPDNVSNHLFLVGRETLSNSRENSFKSSVNQKEILEIAAKSLRENGVYEKDLDNTYPEFIFSLSNNPFLANKVPPLLQDHCPKDLAKEVRSLFKDSNIVDNFYSWRWQELSSSLKTWLVLSSGAPHLLIEVLALCTSKDRIFEPLCDFFSIFKSELVDLSSNIENLRKNGFLDIHSIGHRLDKRSISTIENHYLSSNLAEKDNILVNGLKAEIYSEALTRISILLQNNPNPEVDHYVTSNLGFWACQLKTLWANHSYDAFINGYSQLKQTLSKNRLLGEISTWVFELVTNDPITFVETIGESMQENLAKILALTDAIYCDDFDQQDVFNLSARSCLSWLATLPLEQSRENAALLYHCIHYLTLFYGKLEDYEKLVYIHNLAIRHYLHHEVWERLIPHLVSLSECYYKIGDSVQGFATEKETLERISNNTLPKQLIGHAQLRILTSRIKRKSVHDSIDLINTIEESVDPIMAPDTIESFRAEIDILEEKHAEAAIKLCKLLKIAKEGKLTTEKILTEKLETLRNKLTAQEFGSIYKAYTGLDYHLLLQDGYEQKAMNQSIGVPSR